MKLPVIIKIIFNIIFYAVYAVITILLVGFVVPFIFNYIIVDGSQISYMITAITAIFVLFVTIIFRKYFYISFDKSEEIKKEEVNVDDSFDDLEITIGNKK